MNLGEKEAKKSPDRVSGVGALLPKRGDESLTGLRLHQVMEGLTFGFYAAGVVVVDEAAAVYGVER